MADATALPPEHPLSVRSAPHRAVAGLRPAYHAQRRFRRRLMPPEYVVRFGRWRDRVATGGPRRRDFCIRKSSVISRLFSDSCPSNSIIAAPRGLPIRTIALGCQNRPRLERRASQLGSDKASSVPQRYCGADHLHRRRPKKRDTRENGENYFPTSRLRLARPMSRDSPLSP